jgi:hypothetical protein
VSPIIEPVPCVCGAGPHVHIEHSSARVVCWRCGWTGPWCDNPDGSKDAVFEWNRVMSRPLKITRPIPLPSFPACLNLLFMKSAEQDDLFDPDAALLASDAEWDAHLSESETDKDGDK